MDNLSVFFPAFNEEENIVDTVEKAIKVLDSLKIKNWEILIIDDGSTDNTLGVSKNLVQKHKNVEVITQKNGGYGAALRTGFTRAQYGWIVYTDSDGQFDFSEVTKFIEKTNEYDLLMGYRIKRNDPVKRLILAKGWRFLIMFFFRIYLKDVDCGFKMARKKVIEKISPLESSRGGMINAEIAIRAKKADFRIGQVGVNHYPRLKGKPTGADPKVIINSFIDLFKLRVEMLGK